MGLWSPGLHQLSQFTALLLSFEAGYGSIGQNNYVAQVDFEFTFLLV